MNKTSKIAITVMLAIGLSLSATGCSFDILNKPEPTATVAAKVDPVAQEAHDFFQAFLKQVSKDLIVLQASERSNDPAEDDLIFEKAYVKSAAYIDSNSMSRDKLNDTIGTFGGIFMADPNARVEFDASKIVLKDSTATVYGNDFKTFIDGRNTARKSSKGNGGEFVMTKTNGKWLITAFSG